MKNFISQTHAIIFMISLLSVLLVFHMMILTGIISYAVVWAGKISSVKDMRTMEAISICINSFAILILLLRAGYIQNKIPVQILNNNYLAINNSLQFEYHWKPFCKILIWIIFFYTAILHLSNILFADSHLQKPECEYYKF